jgi:geranylgeranyl pyrophosphate synthase
VPCLSHVAPLHSGYQEYAHLLTTFTSALSRTCLGELGQLRNNRNLGLEIPGYLRIVAGKTAALFSVSAFAGALTAAAITARTMRLAALDGIWAWCFKLWTIARTTSSTKTRR